MVGPTARSELSTEMYADQVTENWLCNNLTYLWNSGFSEPLINNSMLSAALISFFAFFN